MHGLHSRKAQPWSLRASCAPVGVGVDRMIRGLGSELSPKCGASAPARGRHRPRAPSATSAARKARPWSGQSPALPLPRCPGGGQGYRVAGGAQLAQGPRLRRGTGVLPRQSSAACGPLNPSVRRRAQNNAQTRPTSLVPPNDAQRPRVPSPSLSEARPPQSVATAKVAQRRRFLPRWSREAPAGDPASGPGPSGLDEEVTVDDSW